MNVLTASFVWVTFFQKVIQQGYDVNPWITERFGMKLRQKLKLESGLLAYKAKFNGNTVVVKRLRSEWQAKIAALFGKELR